VSGLLLALDPLCALLALEADSVAVRHQVVVDMAHFNNSRAVQGWAFHRVAPTSHGMIDFLSKFEMFVAHLARELYLE